MKVNNFFKLVLAIAVSEAAGVVGAFFTTPSIAGWYATLTRPALNPPAWVFGPVWTTLFALMGISLFLIWKSDPSVAPKERRRVHQKNSARYRPVSSSGLHFMYTIWYTRATEYS